MIGDDQVMWGPFGARRVTYADYTASGRALGFVEDLIRDEVLPRYANTHTESSGTGLQTSRLRDDARQIVHEAVGGTDETCVIFCGSGATGAVDKLIGILGLRIPSALDDRYALSSHIPAEERPVVFVGPFEHHSNELPWRESIADVVVIPEDGDGHVDLAALDAELLAHASRPLKIGSFSAASNVTGILSNSCAIADLLHRHGALSFWDFAAAAPYVEIEMDPTCAEHPLAHKDAVFISPHKLVGGPGHPASPWCGAELLTNRVPDVVGGRTVAYVEPIEHRYLDDPIMREKVGTPAIVEAIRAGLVFQLKQAVGVDVINAHEEDFWRRAVERWSRNENIRILGNLDADRLSIVSFVVHGPTGRYLHHNYVVALLNDLFGIQSRGGCSCAGPYGHRLLGIGSSARSSTGRSSVAGARGSSRAGRASRSTTSSPKPSSSTSSLRSISLPRTAGVSCLPTTSTLSPGLEAPRRPCRAASAPHRPLVRRGHRRSRRPRPRSRSRAGVGPRRVPRRSASHPRRGDRSPRPPTRGSARRSSSCAGSSCPSAASPDQSIT